ncbi:hypothetical protein LZ554_007002 [Drepanopeziza brunnea f. sp. 'monogermtubi']|nr:hypothetical protein LZ554_007002 [Drepanopeziza brunnea f. sp. 'monogermtubi']
MTPLRNPRFPFYVSFGIVPVPDGLATQAIISCSYVDDAVLATKRFQEVTATSDYTLGLSLQFTVRRLSGAPEKSVVDLVYQRTFPSRFNYRAPNQQRFTN